mmetsp:Transcript_28415/g.49616  ORF Transcript_28415/g.49616 Transcript_28415/m.49616 type:complete len:355 (-) Transcript_28415:43-1107(-)
MLRLVLSLMAIDQAECLASARHVSSEVPWGGLRDEVAERAIEQLDEARDELAEARTDFRFQANVLKNVVAEVNDLKAVYKSRLQSQGPRGTIDEIGTTSDELVEEEGASEDPALLYEEAAERSDQLARAAASYTSAEDDELPSSERKSHKSPSFLGSRHGQKLQADQEKAEAFGDTLRTMHNAGQGTNGGRVFLQLIFGVIYYFLVVQKFPRPDPSRHIPPAAVELQKQNPLRATSMSTPKVCALSFLCPGPRAAHTYEITGVMNYWLGLCCMSCFPCCTLFTLNKFTDLNARLGGEPMSFCPGLLYACFCSCCLIAQDAESLDIIVGMPADQVLHNFDGHHGAGAAPPRRICC